MTTAIFIDGPLAQEVRGLPYAMSVYRVPLPRRVTVCWCAPDEERIDEIEPAPAFEYHCVMKGDGVALYSKESKGDAVIRALKAWVVTDLSNTDKLYYSCRDRRAYS